MSTGASDRLFYLFLAVILLLIIGIAGLGVSLALGLGPFSQLSTSASGSLTPTPTGCDYFPATDKRVCGRFLVYWASHGGIAQQGLPISDEFREISEVDGREYTVQYFERTELELHPENQPPNDVEPALLGSILYNQYYPNGAPNQVANNEPGSISFPQTGKHLGGKFLDYWRANGQLQFGYPVSDEFKEKSHLDGQEYLIQYFERVAFEVHPGESQPESILLSQLGKLQFLRRYPDAEPGTGTPGLRPVTVTRTPGRTPSPSASATPSATATPVRTATPTITPSATASVTATATPTTSAVPSVAGQSSLVTPVGEGTWTALESRPLDLPPVLAGGSCPTSQGAQVAPGFGLALGSGPIYAVGLGSNGVYALEDRTQEGGWLYIKVIWIARPNYVGPILIRGRRVDAPGELGFGYGSDPSPELRLEANTTSLSRNEAGWSQWSTYTRVRSTGCYALQVDALLFSEVIIFSVTDNSTPTP